MKQNQSSSRVFASWGGGAEVRTARVQSMNFPISNGRHYFCSQVKSDHQYNDSPWAERDEVMF